MTWPGASLPPKPQSRRWMSDCRHALRLEGAGDLVPWDHDDRLAVFVAIRYCRFLECTVGGRLLSPMASNACRTDCRSCGAPLRDENGEEEGCLRALLSFPPDLRRFRV